MITRNINEVARELTNMVVSEIYNIAKKRQEDEIDLEFNFHNDYFSTMEVSFPDDDEEFETDEEYLDEMDIVVNSEYTDDEGLSYDEQTDITDLDLSVLLKIYNTIKD